MIRSSYALSAPVPSAEERQCSFARCSLWTYLLLLSACGTSHTPDAGIDASERDGGVRPPTRCVEGTALPCLCPDAPDGFSFCLEDGTFGECECSPPRMPESDAGGLPDGGTLDGATAMPPDAGTSCTPGDDEWCDGRDNDCDGEIDDGHVCPDGTVANTLDDDLVVWMRGTSVRGDDSALAVQRLWPTMEDDTRATPGAYSMRFDAVGRLHYQRLRVGVRRYEPGGADVEVPTPPCFDRVGWLIGFDGANRMYYTCERDVRRESGELVAAGTSVSAVLASGRFLSIVRGEHVLYEADGSEVSRFPLAEWVGTMEVIFPNVTVHGDSAFIAFNRVHRGGTRREVVVYRVDADGSWRLVRRIPARHAMRTGIALPDGHFIGLRMWDDDPSSGVVIVFPPSGAAFELRRDGPEHELHFAITDGNNEAFFAGPRSF